MGSVHTIHFMTTGLFMLFGFLLPRKYLVYYIIFWFIIQVHWLSNNGKCVLTELENINGGHSDKETNAFRVLSPYIPLSQEALSRTIENVLYMAVMLALIRLYADPKNINKTAFFSMLLVVLLLYKQLKRYFKRLSEKRQSGQVLTTFENVSVVIMVFVIISIPLIFYYLLEQDYFVKKLRS